MNSSMQKTPRFKKYFLLYLLVLLVIASFAAGLFFGRSSLVLNNLEKQYYEQEILSKYTDQAKEVDFSLFWDVWNLVDEEYIKRPVDHQKMLYGAISGAINALDDPYTQFMDPEETNTFNNELEGTFEGIGAEIGMKNNLLTVIAPLKNSPAEQAGLLAGDVILTIDGQTTQDMGLLEAVALLRGEKGTQVTVSIYRENEKTKEITITRDTIEVKSVNYEMIQIEEKKIAYIEINQFGDKTTEEFKKIVPEIVSSQADGIIIDMRNNAGGYFKTSVEVAGEFLIAGELVAIEKYNDDTINEYDSSGPGRLKGIPIVILVNEGTASAAEILTAALKTNSQAVIVGNKTYGKGTVQVLEDLKDGSSVRISIAEWLTPANENIEGVGITPDHEIELSKDDFNQDKDPQLDKAKELLK